MEKIYDMCGQFLTAFDLEWSPAGVEQVSGIFTRQYRDGDYNGLEELLDLLATSKDSGRRYLARVTDKRRLEVYQEPDPANVDHRLLPSTDVMKGSQVLRKELCPVGMWVKTTPVTSGAIRTEVMASVDPIFIEETTYNILKNQLEFEVRDRPRKWDIIGITRPGR